MDEDAGVGVRGLERFLFLPEDAGEAGGVARVGLGEGRRDEGHGDGLVGTEEMSVHNGVAADASVAFRLRQEGLQEDVAQVERVGADQPGQVAGLVFFDEGHVALHLGFSGPGLQCGGKSAVEPRVDEGRQMLESVVHGAERRFDFQRTEDADDITAGRVTGTQGIGEFVDVLPERPRVGRCVGIGSRNLDKNLVFEPDVAEGQLAVKAGAGQELDDVLLVGQPGAEHGEYHRADGQQGIQQALVFLEIAVYRYE